jgi:L-alanine-DL-glutamate epimerase-like enolase superfamily enzyme
MDETITAIDSIALCIPLDISVRAPMSQGVPRTHVERLYVRVTTSGGVAGWAIVWHRPGFGADPDDDLIQRFRV